MVAANEIGEELRFRCPICQKITIAILNKDKVRRWRQGELIQDVFPELSAEDREVMISGMCHICQRRVFGDPD